MAKTVAVYQSGKRIVERFEIVEGPAENGKLIGGMGFVYLCYDHEENRPVALKTFRPEYLGNRERRDRFLREGSYWVQLGRHPHIVHAYNILRIDYNKEVYLVLEQIAPDPGRQGASLRDWLVAGRALPLSLALLFGLQIVRGMFHAATALPGFVHRDLKPANVLVGADKLPGWEVNRVRVTDFGLVATQIHALNPALVATDDQLPADHIELTRGFRGSHPYMAPEQWTGGAVTAATDIYALGLILYEMVAGHSAIPAHVNSHEEYRHIHLNGELLPLADTVPADIAGIIAGCLAVSAAERYSSWPEVETALAEAYLAITGKTVPANSESEVLAQADRVAQGWALNEIGRSYLDISKPKVALGYFERAQEIGEQEDVPLLAGYGLGNIGVVHFLRGDLKQALDYYEQHLAIAREIGDKLGEASTLGRIGIIHFEIGDARQAIAYQEQSLALAREIDFIQGEMDAVGNLGNAYRALGDAEKALDYLKQQLLFARALGNQINMGTALGQMGLVYMQIGEQEKAIEKFEEHLAVAGEIGDRAGEARALGNLGIMYRHLNQTGKAIEFQKRAWEISREIGDRGGEGDALGNIGLVYLQRGEVHDAVDYMAQQLLIAQELGNRQGEALALGNLGSAYRQLGDYQKALAYLEQALAINNSLGDEIGMARDSINMAYVYGQMGDIDRALALATAAAELFTAINHHNAPAAQEYVAQLQAHQREGLQEALRNFAPVIEGVVAAVKGDIMVRMMLQANFEQWEQAGWHVSGPIQRILDGERDEALLSEGLSEPEALVVYTILARLEEETQ
ncbi:MAG: serine/threonine-protein kinase [Candidatus Promineifilaceae bacterium]|nr:serine/threonine-protein kinase [Candidatus Promineifilaceae bacterium]